MPAPTPPTPALAQALPGSPAAEGSAWDGFLRRGLYNQLVCVAIALVIWLLTSGGRGNFFTAWVYSAAIGTGCWFCIDGGRLLLSQWLPARPGQPAARNARWIGPGWMLACILLGTALGYSAGTALGDALTGLTTPSLWQNRAAIAISLIVAIATTWYFYATERLRAEQAATDAARRQAAESQLMLLQSQLEPHMLFNTLANLRVLISLDPPRAQAMLDRLIGYLRATLGASRAPMHPLSAEFDRLDDYLALMAMRMGPRLQVSLHLPDALRALPVPPLLLQPLVENSIRHGLEPKVAGGRIEVSAERVGDRLRLSVRDTGVGLDSGAGTARTASASGHTQPSAKPKASAPADTPTNSHYGTQHVTARLATLYGDKAHFTLAAAVGPDGGTLAMVDLPLPTDPHPTHPSAGASPALDASRSP